MRERDPSDGKDESEHAGPQPARQPGQEALDECVLVHVGECMCTPTRSPARPPSRLHAHALARSLAAWREGERSCACARVRACRRAGGRSGGRAGHEWVPGSNRKSGRWAVVPVWRSNSARSQRSGCCRLPRRPRRATGPLPSQTVTGPECCPAARGGLRSRATPVRPQRQAARSGPARATVTPYVRLRPQLIIRRVRKCV